MLGEAPWVDNIGWEGVEVALPGSAERLFAGYGRFVKDAEAVAVRHQCQQTFDIAMVDAIDEGKHGCNGRENGRHRQSPS
jgi:hypothetical protein